MTYCLGLYLRDGLVLASDTRTNAGVDNISVYRKMQVYSRPGDRVVVLLSAGNLAITQAVLNHLEESAEAGAEETDGPARTLWTEASLHGVARLVGQSLRAVHRLDADDLHKHDMDFNASFILGGQVRGERPRLFLIYAAGNFIEAHEDTPYFQIGETKYGKPILDRVVTSATTLAEGAKCALVSFDSTMRSNLSVGMPLDLLVYQADSLNADGYRRIAENDPYMADLRRQWGEGMRRLFADIPEPDWVASRAGAGEAKGRGVL